MSENLHPVESCPADADSWRKAGMRLNCPTDKYGRNLYQCAPNEYKTDLVEFCLKESIGRYEEGLCVFAYPNRGLHVDNCSMFVSGCPENSYISDEIYKYPACLKINRDAGCYVADPTCLPSGRTPVTLTGRLDNVTLANTRFTSPAYSNPQDSVNVIATVVSLLLAIILVIVIVFGIIMFFLHRRRMRKKRGKGYKEKEEEEVFDRGTLLDVTMNTAEDEVIERGTMLDVGDPEDINESSTGSNLVYVVEGQEQSEQEQVPGTDPYLRILVVVVNKSILEGKLLSEAQKKFGPGCKLLSVSSYQEQSKDKYETLFTKNFNIKDVNFLQLFEKLREVVTLNKEDATFVVALPFSIWMKERDGFRSIYDKNDDLMIAFVYC